MHAEDFEVRETKAGQRFVPGEGEKRGSIVLFSQANVFMLAETGGYTASTWPKSKGKWGCKRYNLDSFKTESFVVEA